MTSTILASPTPAPFAVGGSDTPKLSKVCKSSSAVAADELEDHQLKDCFIESLRSFSGTRNGPLYVHFIQMCKNRGFEKPSKLDRQRIVTSLVKDGRIEEIYNNGDKHALNYRLPSDKLLKNRFVEALKTFSGTLNTHFVTCFLHLCKNNDSVLPTDKHTYKRISHQLLEEGRIEEIPLSSKHALKYRLPLASPPPVSSAAAVTVAIPPVIFRSPF